MLFYNTIQELTNQFFVTPVIFPKCSCNRKISTDILGQVENSEMPETMEITEIAVEQGNYKFWQ